MIPIILCRKIHNGLLKTLYLMLYLYRYASNEEINIYEVDHERSVKLMRIGVSHRP